MALVLKCDICEQSVWEKYSPQLIRCAICGLVRAVSNPTHEELNLIYQHDYFFGDEYFNYINDRPALEKNFSLRLKRLSSFLNLKSSVIEIGSSYGFFLNLCKVKVRKVVGYDVVKEGVDYAINNFGVEAHCDNFLNYSGPEVDMVCLWDVIEHFPNPGEFINKISKVVKSNGYIAFTTGDIGSFMAKMRGERWRLIHPPTHLFYFDRKSITKLLKKNGFTLVSFKHVGVWRNFGSVLKQLIKRFDNTRIFKMILLLVDRLFKYFGFDKINFSINLFDIMEVIAVKNENNI